MTLNLLNDLRRTDPAAPALTCLCRAASSELLQRWTYGDLQQTAKNLSVPLRRASTEGETVAVLMAADGESVAALLAAQRLGHPAILLPLSLPPHEARALLEENDVSLLFVSPGYAGEPFRNVDAGSQGWIRIPRYGRGDGSALALSEAFICQLTSGSMGAPRLAVRTLRGVWSEIGAVIQRLQLAPSDCVLVISSLAHSYSLIGGVLASLRVGAEIALASDAEGACALAEHIRPTVVFGLAATYRTMLQREDMHAALGQTRMALSAGAPLPEGVFAQFRQHYGLPIRQDYGTTETGTITIDTSDEVQPGCVGAPLSHLEVRLAQPADIRLEDEEGGEIQVRSAATAGHYLAGGILYPCLDSEGWYHTGDAGSFDDAGRLWVGRRLRPSIVIDGVAVRPEAVERAIERLPGVREVVVLGVHDQRGQTVIKAVVAAPGLLMSALHDWCRRQLPKEQQPALFELVEELPRSPAGKILQRYML